MLPPPPDTVERWAWDYLHTTSLAHKLAPPPRPAAWESAPPARRIERPGRPPELVVVDRVPKTPGRGALRHPARRAQLLHTFLHHELQAADLMAWALLAFPEAPPELRRGLTRILDDEVRHASLYAAHLARLGSSVGAFPVRDWLFARVSCAPTPLAFVALLGVGFEGGNLDHSERFATLFREVGDEEAARLQELVGLEEIAHVRFAARWFEILGGPLTFETWQAALPPPLTPWVLKGRSLARAARRRAGLSDAFLDALDAFEFRP